MKFLSNAGNFVKRTALTTKTRVSAKSPEILMVIGGVTFIATVVVACKQTLKCEEILDSHQRKMDDIEDCLELASEEGSGVTYDDEQAKKDKAVAFVQTGVEFAKIYAPAIGLGIISIACFGGSFHIMKKRNLALGVAYTALDTAFREYRGRVKEELGEEADSHFRYGYEKVKKGLIAGTDAEGNRVAVEGKDLDTVPWNEDGDGVLDGATFVFAPETSRYYFPDELHNQSTITSARTQAQIDFDMKGFIFLNDVLKMLGLKEVPYGQLVGWKKGFGDPYIDFRAKPVYRLAPKDPNRNPLGLDYECIWEFDFNHCGTIWDKI